MTEFDRFLSTIEDFCSGKHDNDFGCTTIPLTQCEVPPPLSDSLSLSMLSNANTVRTEGCTFFGSGTSSLSTLATLSIHSTVSVSSRAV